MRDVIEVTQCIDVYEVVGLTGCEAMVGGVWLRELQPGLVEASALHTETNLRAPSTVGRHLVGRHRHQGHQHHQGEDGAVPGLHPSGQWTELDLVGFVKQEHVWKIELQSLRAHYI